MEISRMLFSVIVPVYKVEKYLRKCVDSILEQDFTDFELILVDDGSPDNCPQICDEYEKADSRVKVVHKENGGLSSARNEGLACAKGEYIVYLDSDDFFCDKKSLTRIAGQTKDYPDIIMYKTAACDEKGIAFTYPIMNLVYNPKDTSLETMISKTVSGEEFQTSAWSKSVRRKVLEDNGIEFKDGLLGEDIDWYLHVIRSVSSYAMVDEYLYVYRSRPGSITKTTEIKNLKDLLWILHKWDKILGMEDLDLSLRHYLGKTYTSLLIIYAGIKNKDKKVYKYEVKEMGYLLGYNLYPRTKAISVFYNIFGFDITIVILTILLKVRDWTRK